MSLVKSSLGLRTFLQQDPGNHQTLRRGTSVGQSLAAQPRAGAHSCNPGAPGVKLGRASGRRADPAAAGPDRGVCSRRPLPRQVQVRRFCCLWAEGSTQWALRAERGAVGTARRGGRALRTGRVRPAGGAARSGGTAGKGKAHKRRTALTAGRSGRSPDGAGARLPEAVGGRREPELPTAAERRDGPRWPSPESRCR